MRAAARVSAAVPRASRRSLAVMIVAAAWSGSPATGEIVTTTTASSVIVLAAVNPIPAVIVT